MDIIIIKKNIYNIFLFLSFTSKLKICGFKININKIKIKYKKTVYFKFIS